eukprot:TRINITY_DN72754_c0_g1_i1.p1 TRINITY_DN72754_c0_g1~~TRINITY_DN72754_c0_g1_i1.p1  ORF type:complete len:158 (+),score=47.28 TRINITY_DN72754_c0_g1_i1:85-558(+)
MGKRRSRKAPQKKASAKLPTTFDCPFCNHQSTVNVKIHQATGVGRLECRVCGVEATQRTTYLTKEIDVYCEWMDSCIELNKQGDDDQTAPSTDQDGKRRRTGVENPDTSLTANFLEDTADDDFPREDEAAQVITGEGLAASEHDDDERDNAGHFSDF